MDRDELALLVDAVLALDENERMAVVFAVVIEWLKARDALGLVVAP